MNKSALKSYAPQARRDFIDMVMSRAAQLGLAEYQGRVVVEPVAVQGDVAVIAGQAFPAKIAHQRQQLINRIQRDGFDQTMEAIAYTWFNRFAALRYMELQDGFLRHGQRVLSSTTPGALPDLLTHALEISEGGELPGITPQLVGDLKLTNKDGELYKRLLVAQCNALSEAMPFLFERIDDETELLLPDTLLRTDSVIRKLVDSIDEDDWQQVEIIGWLYQFYILEEKARVDDKIKKGGIVEKSEIPAKTQLFTPNWVVKYLVQNSVGRLWLQANPGSTLAESMDYYIGPAEQIPEVQAELDKLVKTRISEDGDSLNPESITVLDPACGSGHILVEAYELLKAIYLERGYRNRDIPRLILEKNVYGLEIDDRAAQLAGFALLMKARADDRRLFDPPPKLNVYALQDGQGVDDQMLAETVFNAAVQAEGGDTFNSGELFGGGQRATEHASGLTVNDLRELIRLFRHGKAFGSLLSVPSQLSGKLPKLAALIEQVQLHGNALAKSYANEIGQHYLRPTQLLAANYDAVIANPPYLGKGMNSEVKDFAKKQFPDSKSDLFAMFIERGFGWCKASGFNSMVTMQSWMFLSSYEAMREKLLGGKTLSNMVHMGNGVMGIAFGTAATVFWNKHVNSYEGSFSYCENDDVNDDGVPKQFPVQNERLKTAKPDDFKKIPGSPVAYWASNNFVECFLQGKSLEEVATPRQGLSTTNNDIFLRQWFEVSFSRICFSAEDRISALQSKRKWFPYGKGGEARRWYGNHDYVVNWENDGQDVKLFIKNKNPNVARGESNYFKPAVTWSLTSSSRFGFAARIRPNGFIFDINGMSSFPTEPLMVVGLLNSKVADALLKIINPTMAFQVGDIKQIRVNNKLDTEKSIQVAQSAVDISKADWDSSETSWDFLSLPLLGQQNYSTSLYSSWCNWNEKCASSIDNLKRLDEENNRIFIEAYGLQGELSPEVPAEQITLTRADREKDMQRLVSYAIGCVMGRYSLDEPGLIYAHTGNVGFDPSRYATFPADADGIVPVSDMPWFPDDATARVKEFLVAVWGEDTLAENLAWLAESLGQKGDETPEEALRRYISASFFKDHCQTYKKRPIYWLFSSGKHKAFEALVYLHRYHEGTLARLRAEYVVPLTGKMNERIKLLEDDALKAPTAAARKKIDKDIDKLKKKLDELRSFDENLRHYADMRISLDLDDGVKVNYGKFGDLLDGVKSITGGSSDE